MPSGETALEPLEVSAAFAFGVWGDFMITEWRTAITPVGLQAFEAFSARASLKAQPHGRGMIGVINDRSAAPDAAMRAAMAEGLKRYSDRTRSSSLIYDDSGLKASILRSIAAAISTMARESVPMRVFRSVDEAVVWQTKLHGQEQNAAPLAAAIKALRELR